MLGGTGVAEAGVGDRLILDGIWRSVNLSGLSIRRLVGSGDSANFRFPRPGRKWDWPPVPRTVGETSDVFEIWISDAWNMGTLRKIS